MSKPITVFPNFSTKAEISDKFIKDFCEVYQIKEGSEEYQEHIKNSEHLRLGEIPNNL